MEKPYISLVTTARNDNHGGNFVRRFGIFANHFIGQCERHNLKAELLVVEWNPPSDRPRLADALDWTLSDQVQVRIVEFPTSLHSKLSHSQALPLFQMIAKNVGIRRAAADFILASNCDLLFSDELIQFLAEKKLDPRFYYRSDRVDVENQLPFPATLDEQLHYCREHILRVNSKAGVWTKATDEFYRVTPEFSFRRSLSNWFQDLGLKKINQPVALHSNACGDFTLAHRDAWNAVRGYYELQAYSLHIDSLILWSFYHAGFHEKVLPRPMEIYHMEHEVGSGWTPKGEKTLEERLKAKNIPIISIEQFRTWALDMRKTGKPILFNDERWGFADKALEETLLTARSERQPQSAFGAKRK